MVNYSYKEIAYLLGCYVVIADKEINEMEICVLDHYIHLSKEDELYKKRLEIFSDADERVKEMDLVYSLKVKNILDKEKQEIVSLLSRIAYGDNFVCAREKEMLKTVSEALNYNSDEIINQEKLNHENRIRDARLSKLQRFVGNIENVLYNTFADKENEKTVDLLLGSLGYSTTVQKITDIATVDLSRVTKIMDGINRLLITTGGDLLFNTSVNGNPSRQIQDIAKILESTKTHFQGLINVSLVENKEMLEKKRRNVQYFTIAFMGRTKAGKSTLHKIITQQDSDDIGVGKLRTTRYNRSWYWERLRVIDTPGIGAPNGEVDTEIAKSIIDEADIICYIVTSDSIQETEFDFFETIKDRNKPLYIILNVKSNLSQSVRLKRFIDNPFAWHECDGPQSISGHLKRVHDKLDGKYNMNTVQIIPMHLLAAQLGLSHGYDDQTSQKLVDGSNIMEFVRSVKKEVHDSGNLKKSLSIIDGTAYHINSICSTIRKDCNQLSNGLNTLSDKRNKFKYFVDYESSRLQNDLKIIFKSAKDELHNRAASFANEHYDDNNAGKEWQNDSVVKAIHSRLEEKIKTRMQDFNDKAKSEIEEMASDIQLCLSYQNNSNEIKGESITNVRLGIDILGKVISFAAPFVIYNLWNPAGWVIAVGSIVVGITASIFSSLFKSKAEKIKNATEKLKNNLQENIDKYIHTSQEEAIANAKDSVSKMHNAIDDILLTYITNTETIIKQLKSLVSNCELGMNAINSLISFRILEYVGKKMRNAETVGNATNQELVNRYPVSRDWKKQSLTYLYDIEISTAELQKAERATQMKILIEK